MGIWRRFAVPRPFNARAQLCQGSWPDEMKRLRVWEEPKDSTKFEKALKASV